MSAMLPEGNEKPNSFVFLIQMPPVPAAISL
jgi:hypothetical protein